MDAYKIYISSTYRDLIEDRAFLRLKLDQAQYTTVCMEKYPPALSQVIKTKCEDDVKCCDIYIGIIGDNYGSLAKDENGKELDHSYTEYEYDAAVASNKKRLVFFKQLEKESEDQRLAAFKKKITASAFFTCFFKDWQQLATEVLASLTAETGGYLKRRFSPDLRYLCDRAEQANKFNAVLFEKNAAATIHFFLLHGHMFNGHRAFIERCIGKFKSATGEEPIDVSFNVKLNGDVDETKVKETIKELIKDGIQKRFETEPLPDVKANLLFEQLAKIHKRVLFLIMNIQSATLRENFAELYKNSIEKFYREFTTAEDPANKDKRIVIFLNLQFQDNPKNLDVVNKTFVDNPFYEDKKLPTLTKINADDITQWLEFHSIEKTLKQAHKLLQKEIIAIDDSSYDELISDGIFMDDAETMMEAIIEQYNQKTD